MKFVHACILWISLAICSILALSVGASFYISNQTKSFVVNSPALVQPAQAIVVMGAGLKHDGNPSDRMNPRLNAAYELLANNLAPVVVLAGDGSSQEIQRMKNYLIAKGVEEQKILSAPTAVNTHSTAAALKALYAKGTTLPSLLVVSDDYHINRAVFDISQAFKVQGYGVQTQKTNFAMTRRLFREGLASLKDVFLVSVFKKITP